jgi:hypothetical protein
MGSRLLFAGLMEMMACSQSVGKESEVGKTMGTACHHAQHHAITVLRVFLTWWLWGPAWRLRSRRCPSLKDLPSTKAGFNVNAGGCASSSPRKAEASRLPRWWIGKTQPI